jgi:hypothetical protein
MSLPEGFYAEPRFRRSSPDLEKLKGVANLTLDTPGIGLALAIDYYRVEVFAHRLDRDKACGPTAHPDVHYFPITREALILRRASLDDIACGCPVDHPDFDTVLNPHFDQTLVRLLEDAAKARKGTVASTTLTIARARYTISAKRKSDWLNFAVDAFSAFEQVGADVMDRTVRHLNDRLALQLSPRRVGAKMN